MSLYNKQNLILHLEQMNTWHKENASKNIKYLAKYLSDSALELLNIEQQGVFCTSKLEHITCYLAQYKRDIEHDEREIASNNRIIKALRSVEVE